MSKLHAGLVGLALAASLAAPAPALAKNLLNTTFAGEQRFSAPGPLKVFPSGSFTQTFFTTQAETVMLSFSAVCAVSGQTNQVAKIAISVSGMVKGNVAYPTNQASFALCSAAGNGKTSDSRGNYTVLTGIAVKTGSHNLTVQVTPTNGGTVELSSLSIQVWN